MSGTRCLNPWTLPDNVCVGCGFCGFLSSCLVDIGALRGEIIVHWRFYRLDDCTVIVQGLSTALFIPVTRTLARSADCTKDDSTGRWWLDAMSNETGAANGMECWTEDHWKFVAVGVAFFLLFVVLSVRLIRAGGDFSNLHVTKNPFAMGSDSHVAGGRYEHAWSQRGASHETLTLLVKGLAVLGSTFGGTNHPGKVSVLLLVAGSVMLTLTLTVPPYFGKGMTNDASHNLLESRPNRVKCAMDLAIVWIFLCACIAIRSNIVGTDQGATMLRALPAMVLPCLLCGYWLPNLLAWCRRGPCCLCQRIGVVVPVDSVTEGA